MFLLLFSGTRKKLVCLFVFSEKVGLKCTSLGKSGISMLMCTCCLT